MNVVGRDGGGVHNDALTKLLTHSNIKSLSTEDRMDELLAWIRENKHKQAKL